MCDDQRQQKAGQYAGCNSEPDSSDAEVKPADVDPDEECDSKGLAVNPDPQRPNRLLQRL